MHRAAYWHRDAGKVCCDLCPRACRLNEGDTGFCGVRRRTADALETLNYAAIAASAFDPIEKKPLYHFYPGHKTLSLGSIGCNLRCRHCQNWQISCHTARDDDAPLPQLPPAEAVALALKHKCRSLVWTYNEPSIWFEYIRDSAPLARAAGLKTVLVTAGLLNPEPLHELLPHIDAYRLDIKGFSAEFYRWLTGFDGFALVLANARRAFGAGCHVEIVTNLIPGRNDDDASLRGLAHWIAANLSLQTPWHLTAYFPNHTLQLAATEVSSLERAHRIGREAGLPFVYIGNLAGHPAQNTYCPQCKALLIERQGFQILSCSLQTPVCPACGFTLSGFCL
ncbi:MAG: AmmeMemoRadiSam system radical SAM enzyme [Desulfuromonadales bacterium]|nr:AmmeMemoRadiSam system radical SAM enzyme [Desulfuromonadales bacterium]